MELEDLIQHYSNKINLCLEDLETGNRQILCVKQIADETWQGAIADAFMEKIEECSRYLGQVQEEAEYLRYQMSSIRNNMLEE